MAVETRGNTRYGVFIAKTEPGSPLQVEGPNGGGVSVVQGLRIPAHDDFELDDPDQPTQVVYRLQGIIVATVSLRYTEDNKLIGGGITFPGA